MSHYWTVHTNRHSTCEDFRWGWVDGPGATFYWDNGTARNNEWARSEAKKLNDAIQKDAEGKEVDPC